MPSYLVFLIFTSLFTFIWCTTLRFRTLLLISKSLIVRSIVLSLILSLRLEVPACRSLNVITAKIAWLSQLPGLRHLSLLRWKLSATSCRPCIKLPLLIKGSIGLSCGIIKMLE